MTSQQLAPYQRELIQRPLQSRLFLEGPAGSGKTTTAVGRLSRLLTSGIPASTVLVLVPQRTLAEPYYEALHIPDQEPGSQASILTVGGLARRMVELFWPLIAGDAGFARPNQPPSFLTLETALYYMAYLVRPFLDKGLFDSVAIDRNRIYSQVIDNLNKAAIVGFPYTSIGERLRTAWPESTEQAHVYSDAQFCASLFREYCLQNNLLDFSLQMEIFTNHLWPSLLCREYIKRTYCHLIVDNLEEDTPAAHDLLRSWLPEVESALLIFDQDAGYRRFLGADPITGFGLVDLCDEHHVFTSSFITSEVLSAFGAQVGRALERNLSDDHLPLTSEILRTAIDFPERPLRFYPQMLDWVVERITHLVAAGTPPGEIVILVPFLPDSLRFSLTNRLEKAGVAYRSHRPSRSLREEPVTQALLTLACLAYPEWNIHPARFEVAYALIQVINGLDLVRAQLMVDIVYRPQAGPEALLPFDRVKPELQDRITYLVGNRYETLRQWIAAYASQPEGELDFFFTRLFGELLSQPGFGFHDNLAAGQVCANLIESAQKFRWSVDKRLPAPVNPEDEDVPPGKAYVQMIQEGILAAQYIQSWQTPDTDAVLIAPAYTFLLSNQPVNHQFWLDVGSQSWFERLYQPITHPYILTREWPDGQLWTDVEENETNREALYHLVLGLVRRCRTQIHLGLCELNESGYESKGALLRVIQQVLQQSRGYRA